MSDTSKQDSIEVVVIETGDGALHTVPMEVVQAFRVPDEERSAFEERLDDVSGFQAGTGAQVRGNYWWQQSFFNWWGGAGLIGMDGGTIRSQRRQ